MSTHVSYLNPLTPQNFSTTVAEMVQVMKDNFPDCNMIMGRGLSGSMIIPALAAALEVEWAIARKKDDSHSSYGVEVSKWHSDTKVVFVDDLIDTGDSFLDTLRVVKQKSRFEAATFECLGAACYDDYHNDAPQEYKTVYRGPHMRKKQAEAYFSR